MSHQAKRWRIHAHDMDRIATLQRAAGVPAVVAQLLICRGTNDPAAAKVFLDPKLSALRNPEDLPGCSEAARRIHQAIAAKERIVVYGDYDVDGMTGTAILVRCLRMLGGTVSHYLPNRLEEGYGLNCDAIRTLAAEGTKLLISVDCGITSTEEAALARELGCDVIITDHHEPAASLPQATAIVHPRLPGGAYPFGGLSGSGVAFKLAWAVCQEASGAKKVGDRMKNFLIEAVGLAALGTVADVVPLVDENRVLVHHALTSIAQQPTLGIGALLAVTGLKGKRRLDADDIGFMLAPRLNAAGRLGQAQLAMELLVTDRADRAAELASYIHQLNESRQKLERSILLAAGKQIQEQFDADADPAFVLADYDWHPGVIGIVAGRLAEKYHRPVVLIAWDRLGVRPGTGSARSIPGFALHEALRACGEHLVAHGGHAAAAGLRIKRDKLDAFRAAFCEAADTELRSEPRAAELRIDAEAPFSAMTLETVRQIERLAPFGQGNARPVLCASGVSLAEPPKTLKDGRHLAVKLKQHDAEIRCVAFGGGEWAEELGELAAPIDVAFRPVINSFRDRQSVELHLVDWRKRA